MTKLDDKVNNMQYLVDLSKHSHLGIILQRVIRSLFLTTPLTLDKIGIMKQPLSIWTSTTH